MKLVLVLALCALATAAPRGNVQHDIFDLNILASQTPEGRNILINILIQQLFEFLRSVINNGSPELGIPVLDPLNIDSFHLYIPAGIINLDLQLEKIHAKGFGQFVVHKSELNLNDLTFDIDISLPRLDISADKYDLVGDFYSALPLYGAGKAKFLVEGFNLKSKIYLTQSEDGKAVIIDKFENTSFKIPSLKSGLTGVIGGGDIDAIVNKVTEDVIFDYVNRFQGAIALVTSTLIPIIVNPFLAELDTWRFIEVLLPRS